jgi:ketosteroid isomerase-like protein
MATGAAEADLVSKAMTIFEGWNAGNSDLTFKWFAADAKYFGTEMVDQVPRRKWYEGKQAIVSYLSKWHTIKVTYTVSYIAAIDDLVIAEWTNEGVFHDGSKYENGGVMMVQFLNGMIHEVRIYADSKPSGALALIS